MLAVFAVATVLDDLRILQRAARCAVTLADEFATLLNNQPEDSLIGDDDSRTAKEDDVIRQWKEACGAIAAAARGLGEDPLHPELQADLHRQVNALTELRAPVTEALNRASPEKLLQRARHLVTALAEGTDSPIAPWTDQIAAQWQSAYPLPADSDVESLRADVERVEAELPDALVAWRTARRHRAEVERRHEEARQRAEHEFDPLKRLDAQDQEAKLQQQLGSAAEEIPRARDRVFQIVAPADQAFDPRVTTRRLTPPRHPQTPPRTPRSRLPTRPQRPRKRLEKLRMASNQRPPPRNPRPTPPPRSTTRPRAL